jgi:hypothetical protein
MTNLQDDVKKYGYRRFGVVGCVATFVGGS